MDTLFPAGYTNNILQEKYGTTGRSRSFDLNKVDDGLVMIKQGSDLHDIFSLNLKDLFKSVFLPQGYPESVSEDYLEYQIWDTIQAFCSSITGTLAMQAMLKGYGVGDKTATALGATITWMFRDGTGMLGRITFAWWKGSQLDCDAKRWRLFADVLNDFAMLLELLAPLYKSYFLLIACVAGVSKSIVGVSGGATRAALTQHQARRNNMADVSAKDGSQETLVNLLALIAGFVITPLVANNQPLVWFLFIVFTFLHLFANYRAVSAVIMESVNLPRLNILLVHYLNNGQILSPKHVAELDPVIRGPGYRRNIKLGSSLEHFRSDRNIIQLRKGKNYITKIVPGKFIGIPGSILVALHKDSTPDDVFMSGIHAVLMDALLEKKIVYKDCAFDGTLHAYDLLYNLSHHEALKGNKIITDDFLEAAHELTFQIYRQFVEKLESCGWVVSRTHFAPDEWRYVWSDDTRPKKEM